MAYIYSNVIDSITKQIFHFYIPSTYNPNLGKLLARPDRPTPVYQADETGEDYASLATIHVVDMCFHRVPFRFVKPEDIIVVVELLAGYLNFAKDYNEADQNERVFYDRAKGAYAELYSMANQMKRYHRNLNKTGDEPVNISELLGG